LPFGSPGAVDQGDVSDIKNFVPTWMRTAYDFVTGGDGNEHAYATAVMSMAGYLRTTGDYGTTRAETQRLMDDARNKGRALYFIKALAQGTLPSSPAEDWQVVTKDDKTVRLRALAEEYRKMQDENYEGADREFLNAYGEDVLAAVQPKSA